MKYKTIAVLSLLTLISNFVTPEVSAAAKNSSGEKKIETSHEKAMRKYKEHRMKEAEQKRKEEAKKSVWDDNPYFKGNKANKKTEQVEEKGPKKTTFKRRVYTGPRKDEIFETARKKATGNFDSFTASEDYTIQYDKISYDVESDTLSVDDMTVIPKQKNIKVPVVPYLMKVKELTLRNFNIGEIEQTPIVTDDGELTVRKAEIPIWNEERIKKGKVEIGNITMKGEMVSFLKKREGKYQSLEVKSLRSEKIINETILNNIIRSKVFSASSANFKNGKIEKTLMEALKEQNLSGFEFSEARINGQDVPTMDGVVSALTSYSARILNTDMVWGARLEAKKGKNAETNPEQFKKNVEETKAAIKKLENEK